MSLTEFSSGNDGTRPIQAGDTPDIQDDYAVSIGIEAGLNVVKGTPYVAVDGLVTAPTTSSPVRAVAPVVPTESKDNSSGGDNDLEVRCITAGQMIALLNNTTDTLDLQRYVGLSVSTAGNLHRILQTADNTANRKYARYVGKEGAIFERKATTAYDETLSVGIVPDQSLEDGDIGWFQLVESAY